MGAPRVRWLFHGSVVVRDYFAALAWLQRYCGCRVLEYSESTDPIVARNGGVTWIGDAGLELIEPTLPEGAAARFLARFGPGMYGLAFQVDDLAAAADWFEQQRAPYVGEVSTGYVFTQPRATEGIHLEWADKDFGDFDPHFGRVALPEFAEPPRLEVERVAFFGALVDDPERARARLQQLCPAPLLFQNPAARAGEKAVGLGYVDASLVLYPMSDDATARRLWGPLVNRPRLHLMALRVRDLEHARAQFAKDGVRRLWDRPDAGEFMTDPRDTHGIALLWTDRDLPNDPRGPL